MRGFATLFSPTTSGRLGFFAKVGLVVLVFVFGGARSTYVKLNVQLTS